MIKNGSRKGEAGMEEGWKRGGIVVASSVLDATNRRGEKTDISTLMGLQSGGNNFIEFRRS